jgi:DNA modification methylase
MTLPINSIICGDCLEVMADWPDNCVDCCVTSPPYWGLRDYGVDGQLGLEKTPEEYVAKMVKLFAEVRRVLKDDGTLWLNLGDSYNAGRDGGHAGGAKQASLARHEGINRSGANAPGLKPKDLCGIPWSVAKALQADGWYLRQDIIWHKPNPMPESVRDRCTKAHEYIFLMSKNQRYYYDQEAVKEPLAETTMPRMTRGVSANHKNANGPPGQTRQSMAMPREHGDGYAAIDPNGRNKRSVWTVTTQSFPDAHFATYPEKLIEPCILAGCPEQVCPKCGKARERVVEIHDPEGRLGKGYHDHENDLGRGQRGVFPAKGAPTKQTAGWTDCGCGEGFKPGIVLDPFGGSGTTGVVAARHRRNYILIELNEKYINEIARPRLASVELGVPVKEQKQGQMAMFGDNDK